MRRAVDRDLAAAGIFAALVVFPLLPQWSAGLVHYWGDLGYLNHPWRAYDAQLLRAGRFPSWNPYLYLGMPTAATMQDGLFYPLSALFSLFPFPAAAEAFAALHVVLAGWLTYLWLRACRLRGAACLLGGAVVCLGGIFLENRVFLNHLSTLALIPAILLCVARPGPLPLALALGFLAGYPPFFIGAVALALGLSLWDGGRPRWAGWAAGGAAAAALSGCLLLPASELAGLSKRSAGVGLEEALQFAFSPRDLLHWISPLAVWWEPFNPSALWWKTCFIGFAASAAAVLGLRRVSRRAAAGIAIAVGAVLLLTLGAAFAPSRAAWRHFTPLRFVRYPGNLTYLALWPLALLAACGVTPGRRWLVVLAVAELSVYSWKALPVWPAAVFGSRGPLIERLQRDLGGDRYLISPRALEASTGKDPVEWSERLYGLTNAPYRLRAAANFGEPLVPRANYEVMDALLSAPSAARAAALMPWVDAKFLLTPGPIPAGGGLEPAGEALWSLSRRAGPVAPAYFFPDGREPPASLAPLPLDGKPLDFSRPREDRFAVSGQSAAPGWVYVSEPLYPGWKTTIETEGGARPVTPAPAMTAFQKIPVPAGRWRLTFRYDSGSGRLGRFLTLAALALLAGFWRRRLLRWQTTF